MRHVVARIAKDATTVGSHSSMPVPEDDGMGERPEWGCERDKQSGRHHETVLVHGEVVVDTVEEKVQGDSNTVVWQVAA